MEDTQEPVAHTSPTSPDDDDDRNPSSDESTTPISASPQRGDSVPLAFTSPEDTHELQELEISKAREEVLLSLLYSSLLPSSSSKATPPPNLSNGKISAWFQKQEDVWDKWAVICSRRDPNRLLPTAWEQQRQLCNAVKGFVQLTNADELPSDILQGGVDAVKMLLHGMLANFVCSKIIASPFWLLEAAVSSPVATTGALKQGFTKLYHILSEAQETTSVSHDVRKTWVRLFAQGGMDLRDPPTMLDDEGTRSRHTLHMVRQNYARQLRDDFLSNGPLLIAEPDPDDSERLLKVIDDALIFSCRLWPLDTLFRVNGRKELAKVDPGAATRLMNSITIGQDGYNIIVVVQPAVEAIEMESAFPPEGRGGSDD